jgi:hypothetical protein
MAGLAICGQVPKAANYVKSCLAGTVIPKTR